ncbi:DUF134 domain-containing protein [Pararhodospirillum oryzae]|uniref:UPF0251 protein ROR02_20070 n=1 Tax=Pararhodospirillum oryzae TaxID=478448 RepID=A0A512H8U3_9PROT|nr:DUF134 domain-containing protein [Pararhodospirillum oryzae]GEO81876.1 hypothetical protein ROR02_20070 [Pararhodospirillum oryzae]
MPRPRRLRRVAAHPPVSYYKPQGIPLRLLSHAVLSVDGLEALRLADALGLDHDEAAARMDVSRPTFSRLLAEARRVVAEALTQGWALRIEGGEYRLASEENGPLEGGASGCPLDEAGHENDPPFAQGE